MKFLWSLSHEHGTVTGPLDNRDRQIDNRSVTGATALAVSFPTKEL